MSVLETILIYVVPVIAVYVLVTLLVLGPGRSRRQRYRAGQPWPYEPLFWTANPEGAPPSPAVEHVDAGARTGAKRGVEGGIW